MSIDPQCIIYGLVDPRTLLIRYVGLSSMGMRRPRSHREGKGSSGYCKNWIKSLSRLGLTFGIVVLEVLQSPSELDQAECWWIAFGRACGWPLTNLTEGGSASAATRAEQRKQKALIAQRRAKDRAESERKEAELDAARRRALVAAIAERWGMSFEEANDYLHERKLRKYFSKTRRERARPKNKR